MARRILPILASQLLVFFISSFSATPVTGEDEGFARSLDRKLLGLKKEKLSHFRFYWHDIVSGRNPFAVQVVPPASNASSGFGKAQGLYASASQKEPGLLMVMNFAFIEGKYNGSTITILGRNSLFSAVREMPVIGGSGLFRFARGYVQARTHTFDVKTGDATVEYNAYVLHY
ncbi:hypothetical protein FH972_009615 [Carpinus fangiana]|uniref:Dirigent protein n=1 Tax=Carpinus fangiana TaxID=176857 RepID=A0A660KKU6_9ROSI|nr:hypothetical protein FH972_009615 [Carpinus fangiana]